MKCFWYWILVYRGKQTIWLDLFVSILAKFDRLVVHFLDCNDHSQTHHSRGKQSELTSLTALCEAILKATDGCVDYKQWCISMRAASNGVLSVIPVTWSIALLVKSFIAVSKPFMSLDCLSSTLLCSFTQFLSCQPCLLFARDRHHLMLLLQFPKVPTRIKRRVHKLLTAGLARWSACHPSEEWVRLAVAELIVCYMSSRWPWYRWWYHALALPWVGRIFMRTWMNFLHTFSAKVQIFVKDDPRSCSCRLGDQPWWTCQPQGAQVWLRSFFDSREISRKTWIRSLERGNDKNTCRALAARLFLLEIAYLQCPSKISMR